MPGTRRSNPGGGKKKRDGTVDSGTQTEQRIGKRNDVDGTPSNRPKEDKDKKGTRTGAEKDKGGGLFGYLLDQVKSGIKGTNDTRTEKDQATKEKPAEPEKRSAKPTTIQNDSPQRPNRPESRKPKVDVVDEGSTIDSHPAREVPQSSRHGPESQVKRERKQTPKTRKADGASNSATAPGTGANEEPELSTDIPTIVIDEAPTTEASSPPSRRKGKLKAEKDEEGPPTLHVPNRREVHRDRRRKRVAKDEREGSMGRSVTGSRDDRSTKPATKSQLGQATQTRPKPTNVHDAGIQAEIPTSTQHSSSQYHNDHDHEHTFNDTTAATHGSNIQFSSQTSQPFSGEYVEARCAICGFLIYVDPKTGERVDLANPPQEICPVCGQAWPLGKPFTKEMEEIVNKRLENSPFKNVLCKRCASTVDAGGEINDRGVQVDERELRENGSWRDDHHCIPLDFERTEDSESQSFPTDPKWRGGTKKALLIGINYSGQKNELKGCRNDVKNIYHYLKSNGYKDENIDILMDIKPYKSPTKQNILKHMEKLAREAKPGDYLFLHFSGHGGQTKDWGGDELDGKDECIYPVDFRRTPKGMIVDDEMHRIFIKIPRGVQLTALFDSCHSGSILDLPYTLEDDHMKKVNFHNQYTTEENELLSKGGTIFLWSGCKDKQTSADTKIKGTAVGAMSAAFIKANRDLLKEKNGDQTPMSTTETAQSTAAIKDYTYDELLDRIRLILHERSQVPQLSSTPDFKPTRKKVYV